MMAMATAPTKQSSHALTLDNVMAGIRDQESGGDYHAQSSTETASGAYQYIDSTWNNYQNYAHAKDAPAAVQDQRMREDLLGDFKRFGGDWERVIAAHFVGDNGADAPKSSWDQVPGDPESHNPTIRSYVDSVIGHIQGDTAGSSSAAHITSANTDQLTGSTAGGADSSSVATDSTAAAEGGGSDLQPSQPAGHSAQYTMDPGAAAGAAGTEDHDGLTAAFEKSIGSDPFHDTDGDGLSDSLELSLGTDPNRVDTDGDGRTDGAEIRFGSNPLVADGPTNFVAPAATTTTTAASITPGASGSTTTDTTATNTTATNTSADSASAAGQTGTITSDQAPAKLPAAKSGDAHHTVQYLMDEALAQRGDSYVMGPGISMSDPNPTTFDCSTLTEWAAHQAGVEIPGTSYEQYLYLKSKGLLIPVDKAEHIKGALLFEFSSEPTPGGGRPSEAHVVLSMGDGEHSMEAKGTQYGVNVFNLNGRFNYAAVLPGLDYGDENGAATTSSSAAVTPSIHDSAAGGGLTVDDVMAGLRDQESGGNYQAQSSTETASGAYQYINSTWGDYQGYARAKDAPPDVQDAKARTDLLAAYKHFDGDWERVIAAHFVGEGDADGPKSGWDRVPFGDPASNNPTIRSYVDSVVTHIKEDTGATLGGSTPGKITTANTDQLTTSTTTGSTGGADDGGGGSTGTSAGHAASTTTSTHAADPAMTAAHGTYALDAGGSAAAPGDVDTDKDGLTDRFELSIGTDPHNADSDHDGLTDGYEVMRSHTNPLDPDTDHDGLTDSFELGIGTDPNDPDSDHDGFTDSYEVRFGTNPLGSAPVTDATLVPDSGGEHHTAGTNLTWH